MPLSRFPISLPQNQTLNEQESNIAVSPVGKLLIYVGGVGANRQLFLRELNQTEGKELPETKGAIYPFFSADGQSIGFRSDGKLKTLFLDGGKPKILCDAPNMAGGTWCPDGTIFFTPSWSKGIWKVSANGGDPEQVTTPEKEKGEFGHWWPEVLPGGETALFTIWKTSLNDAQVAVLLRETGESRVLVTGASNARYAPTGHLLYAQSGTLVAAPFDLKQLKVGKPRPVIEGLKQYPDSGYAPFSFSKDGLLYYVRGGEWLAHRHFVWINRQGEEIEPLPLPPQAYSDPSLSPDGRRIAFTKFDRGVFNIWVYDLPSGPATQVTFESSNFLPIWMPDSNRLTFTSYRAGPFDVYWMPINRSRPEEPLLTGPSDNVATSWSPDGKVLLVGEINSNTGWDIRLLSTEDDNTSRPFICESGSEQYAVFSPNGNWIAYESEREVRSEIYVSPYPKPVPKKISTGGGYHSAWSPDGKELFYRNGDKMMAVTIETESELKVTNSEVLFEGQYYTGRYRNYDVSFDGQRFLMIKESEDQPAATQLIVVLHWFEELKRLVPPGKYQ
jgi:Tol biopolymer transport system component